MHRLGQSESVTITRFVIKNSIEEKILKMHEKKNKLSSTALTGKLDAGVSHKEAKEVIIYYIYFLYIFCNIYITYIPPHYLSMIL